MKRITAAPSGTSAMPCATVGTNADNAKDGVTEANRCVQHPMLSDRPPSQSSGGAKRPRRTLIDIRSSSPTQSAKPSSEFAKTVAAKLCSQVNNGAITLVGTYSAAAVTAAASAAFEGLTALKRDFLGRGDPCNTAPG